MATINYKGHVIERPKNVSMATIKKAVNHLGPDYSFTVNDVIKLISLLQEEDVKICGDPVTSIQMFSSKQNGLYELGAE